MSGVTLSKSAAAHLHACPTCLRRLPGPSVIPNKVIKNVAKILNAYSDLPSQVIGYELSEYAERRDRRDNG